MKFNVGDIVVAKANRPYNKDGEYLSLKDKIAYISRIDKEAGFAAYYIIFQGIPDREFWYKQTWLETVK